MNTFKSKVAWIIKEAILWAIVVGLSTFVWYSIKTSNDFRISCESRGGKVLPVADSLKPLCIDPKALK